jgi:hypothetical protein
MLGSSSGIFSLHPENITEVIRIKMKKTETLVRFLVFIKLNLAEYLAK